MTLGKRINTVKSMHRISIVVPVYNEAAVLTALYSRLVAVVELYEYDYEIIFIDDGSHDESLRILQTWANHNTRIKVLALSRNFGHQATVSAGLYYATGDAVIIIDADLQDPPEAIPSFVAAWDQGYDVV